MSWQTKEQKSKISNSKCHEKFDKQDVDLAEELNKLCFKRITDEKSNLLQEFQAMRVSENQPEQQKDKFKSVKKSKEKHRKEGQKFKRKVKKHKSEIPLIRPSKLSHILSSASIGKDESISKSDKIENSNSSNSRSTLAKNEKDLSECCLELETFTISRKSVKRKKSYLHNTEKRNHCYCHENLDSLGNQASQEENQANQESQKNNNFSCAQQAMSMDDLADLWLMVFPKKMSKMAEMMYT